MQMGTELPPTNKSPVFPISGQGNPPEQEARLLFCGFKAKPNRKITIVWVPQKIHP